ncbi:hypothetical protein AN639_03860 [Candidatus Epulonipiscium fishelsonii]|uniref:Uncharacterized protein n=1 Tax=Candidatus Epulonipiscium fishelsonii TaxID=77094 RepID=A0ACC8XAR3_9FIRM|nr:hypothetical protein AN396_08520 [Epulopiscium sp. SCG-B11WGA-EpuloA1]ONI41196.1 hypothetical protein AN639_03860 [Epulopiscium sp. SCG-B05WGA-EpuloA1]
MDGDAIMEPIENLLELPIKVILNNETLNYMLCTPQDVDLLFTGWLLSEGLISSHDDITSIKFDVNYSTVYIEAKYNLSIETLPSRVSKSLKKDIIVSKMFINEISPKLLDLLYTYGNILQNAQVKGLHGALLYNSENGTYITKQDISRHCAIDKVIGYSMKHDITLENTILFTTGRISSEFISKVLNSSIPMIASIKYPSITAEIVAKDWNINMASNILTDKITVYPATNILL